MKVLVNDGEVRVEQTGGDLRLTIRSVEQPDPGMSLEELMGFEPEIYAEKVVLSPRQARRVALALLNIADEADREGQGFSLPYDWTS
jgi:hypothetical protein